MKRTLSIVLVLLMLAAIVARQGKFLGKSFTGGSAASREAGLPESLDKYMEYAKVAFPDADNLSRIDSATISATSSSGNEVGRLLFTSPYSDKIIGYAGPTPLLIAVDSEGKIVNVQLLDNAETPSFVRKVSKKSLFDSWNGLSVNEALAKKVDNISGATFTTQAVVKSLHARLQVEASEKSASSVSWSSWLKQLCQLLILALALFSFFRPAKAKKFRIPLLVLSLVVLGFWQGSMLSLAQLFSWLINGMSLATQWVMLLILLCAVLLPMFTGKAFYCVYLCPFGAAQELVGKLNTKKLKLKHSLVVWLLLLRKAILVAIVLLLILGLDPKFLHYIEPFSAFSLSAAPLAAIIIAVVSLVLSIFISKPWCRFLCPTGQALDFMKKEISPRKK